MASLALGVKFNPASGGTGDFVYASAVSGYVGPAATSPAMVDGKTYRYRAESADLSQWEWGFGVYTASTQTIARTTITLSSTGSKVSFSLAPQVGITAYPADLLLTDLFAIRVQKFASSGTYTPDPHLLYATIECVGGGGGGGGATGNATGESAGGGGGSGAYARKTASAATIGVSQVVTIGAAGTAGSSTPTSGGAGGDTSVGAICVAKGGSGGAAAANNGEGVGGAGGSGAAGTGDLTPYGNAGGSGLIGGYPSNFVSVGGAGAGSFFGGGPAAIGAGSSGAGNAGNNYGAGGGGGVVYGNASNFAGGAGAAGVVVITEYCSQ